MTKIPSPKELVECFDKAVVEAWRDKKEELMSNGIGVAPKNVALGKGICNKIEGALFIVRREEYLRNGMGQWFRYVVDIDSEHLFDSVMIGTNVVEVKGDIERLSST